MRGYFNSQFYEKYSVLKREQFGIGDYIASVNRLKPLEAFQNLLFSWSFANSNTLLNVKSSNYLKPPNYVLLVSAQSVVKIKNYLIRSKEDGEEHILANNNALNHSRLSKSLGLLEVA